MIKKGIILSAVASSILCVGAVAETLEDRLHKLESQMQKLAKENVILKDSIKSNISEGSAIDPEEIEELDERLGEVEMLSFSDRIQFGIGFKTRVENFKKEMSDGTSFNDNNIWSSKVMLNLKSKITDDMKFGGRLSMYKYWADSTKHTLNNNDSMQGRIPSDSTLYVERAYIDWVLNSGSDVPVVLTIGRQPSSDGPSYTFMDDTTRKSTYSALAFDGASDGLVTTINLAKVTGIENTAFRIAYGKQYQHDETNPYSMTPFTGANDDNDINTKDSNILGLFFDTSIPNVPNSLVQLGYVNAKDLNVMGSNIGDVSIYGASVELQNIASTGLDFFAHYGVSSAKSNGGYVTMSAGFDMNGDGDATNDYMNMSLLGASPTTSIDTSTKKGNAFWVGSRYTLPNKGKIGLEYNQGSENWFSFTNAPHDTYNKLATRGNATEVYYIQPINKYSFLRVGSVVMDYKYSMSGSPLGTPMQISQNCPVPQTDKLTNYYLQFNLLY
jgi:regulator of replication initiation timing